MTEADNSKASESSVSSQDAPVNAETAANEIVVDGGVTADMSSAPAQEREAAAATEQDGFAVASNNMGVLLPGDLQMLQLADILQGEHDGNLDAYLKFTSDGTNTTIHVSTSGEVNWHETEIVLQGVGDLTAGGVRSASTIVADLLAHGTLITDV